MRLRKGFVRKKLKALLSRTLTEFVEVRGHREELKARPRGVLDGSRCDIIVKCWDEFTEKETQVLSC